MDGLSAQVTLGAAASPSPDSRAGGAVGDKQSDQSVAYERAHTLHK